MSAFPFLAWPGPEALALLGAPRPPTPPLLAILGFWPGWRPDFLLSPKAPPMNSPTIALVVSILTLAARLGKALGPDAAASFFDDLFAGKIGPEAAAEKAAAALSVALDVGILAAQLSALQGILLAADAQSSMNKAIDFAPAGGPVPLISPTTEAGFAALERSAQGGSDDHG